MTTIHSPQNPRLKALRKLATRRERARTGAFLAEGEDLIAAAELAGRPVLEGYRLDGSQVGGEHFHDVARAALAGVSTLGSGTRVIAVYEQRWVSARGPLCVYLHGVGDPGNVGTIIRTVHALLDGPVVLGPGCADPFSPKAVRASMGSIFGQPVVRGEIAQTPAPRVALVAHGGEGPAALAGAATLCLGAEREGLPQEVLAQCETKVTVPLRPGGAESLNVAAVAAICAERISSLAMPEDSDGH